MNKSGIYIIQCNQNGKIYLGSSSNIERRFYQHRRMLEQGNHHCAKLQKDYDNYGVDKFEFKALEYCSLSDARKKELDYIETLNIKKFGYNSYNLKNTTKVKWDRLLKALFEYFVENGYDSNGDIYRFNIFNISKKINIPVYEILKIFGIQRQKSFNFSYQYLETNEYIGFSPDKELGIVMYVWNFNKKDEDNIEIIDVDF